MTSQARAIELSKVNLHDIFAENNVEKRKKTIQDIWVPSDQMTFVDEIGVFSSHDAMSDMIDEIIGKVESMGVSGDPYIEIGNVKTLAHDKETDPWVTQVKWGIKPPGSNDFALRGEDVITIVGGQIKVLYVFLER